MFVPVNALLFAINSLVNPQTRWFLWPLLIWGGVLAVRAARVFWLRDRWSRWEQERLQKILRKP
nr:2TM domain-containing protein [Dickeya dianthicola]